MKPKLIRRYAILVALALGWPAYLPGQIPEGPVIKKIQVEHVGPAAASDSLIKANIRSRVGEPYNRSNIDEDVRSLYATGYFSDVRVGEERSRDGVVVTYALVGKPVLTEIQFNGNKRFSRSRLLKKVSSKPGQVIDERKLFADRQEILKYYQKKGYQKTTVAYKLKDIDENAGRAKVLFDIAESPRVKIKRVDFVGAKAFTQSKLRKVIKTRKRWMFSWITGSGVLKDEQFDDDKEKLTAFYRNEGYIDFSLQDVKFEVVDEKWMIIKIFISEGRQYKVGAVEFQGNKLFPTAQITNGVVVARKTIKPEMTVGKTFTPKGMIKDVEAVQDFYGSKGYIGKDTDEHVPVRVKRTANVERSTMDLTYEVEEGEPSKIEKIEIRGNVKTKDRVIRRELAVTPGETFDMTRVKLSQARLIGLDYFEKVEMRPEPTEVPNRRNLVVGVEEKNTGKLYLGAGFSTIDQIVGFVELYQGNFDLFNPPVFQGGGQKFRLRVAIGTERQDYTMTFIEPWFLNRKLQFSLDLYHHELNFLSDNDYYEERQTGGRVGLKRALFTENLIGGVSYTLENIGIVHVTPGAPDTIKQEDGYHLISKPGASLAYDTRNSATFPEHGQRTELLSEIAGGPFGGDYSFYRLDLRSSWYFPGFAPKHIFQLTGGIGVEDNYGDSSYVPFYEHWYLGGMYSLRGFKFRRAGADNTYDLTGAQGPEPVGGESYWYASAEYSVPVFFERLRFAVFYDIGNVYRDAYDFNFGEFLDNWGVGLRFYSPFGPMRFDYGIPINTGKYTGNSGRFNFGVGFTREW